MMTWLIISANYSIQDLQIWYYIIFFAMSELELQIFIVYCTLDTILQHSLYIYQQIIIIYSMYI